MKPSPLITLQRIANHRLAVRFRFDRSIIDLIRSIPGRLWHKELHYWSLPDTVATKDTLLRAVGPERIRFVKGAGLSMGTQWREKLDAALKLDGYSPQT